MAKPTKLPEWASGVSADVTEPSAGEKALGWEAGKTAPAGWMNWLQELAYDWFAHLQNVTLVTLSNWKYLSLGLGTQNDDLNGVVSNGDVSSPLWVCVGDTDGADAIIVTSLDLDIWTQRTNPSNLNLEDICHNGTNQYVAVGQSTGVIPYMIYSANGTTWTAVLTGNITTSRAVQMNAVAHDQSGLYVAVGEADGTDAYILTSTDGINWTERTNPKNVALNDVAYDSVNSLWCAVGDLDTGQPYIITSSDGITWTQRTGVGANLLLGIDHDQVGRWVAVSPGAVVLTSTDGTTWTSQATPTDANGFSSVAANSDGAWVAGGFAGVSNHVMVSANGEDWELVSLTATGLTVANVNDLNDVGFFDGRFVAVGSTNATEPLIYTSLNVPTA